MTLLEARDLVVEREGREVVRVERLAVERGETLAVLGPNGAGKTTLLLALAALIPSRGELRVDGASVRDDGVAYRRRIAVVLQRPLLLDRSVKDNAALGLELRGVAKVERERRAAAALARLGVAELADRDAGRLSGGEAQRVSIARSLALAPELLFLDEPFAGLDAPTRQRLVRDLARILAEERAATIHVTHDRDDALALADRVAVLIDGRIRQVDRTDEVFGHPSDETVASFVGVENVLPAIVESVGDEVTVLRVAGRQVSVTATPPEGADRVLLLVAPDAIVISRARGSSSERNAFEGRVTSVEPLGRRMRIAVDCSFPLVAHVTRQSVRELAIAPGEMVIASFKATEPHLLPHERAAAGN